MYLFAHLGLGYLTVKPCWWKVPTWPLLLGCVLPDLIDKPTYYALVIATGKRGADLGLISGTRTFAHTGLFLLMLLSVALARRSRAWLAVALGVATHLFLDGLNDFIADPGADIDWSRLLWPYLGWDFPVMPYANLRVQLGHWLDSRQLVYELLGVLVLIGLVLKSRNSNSRPR